jgi:hypothetical protein
MFKHGFGAAAFVRFIIRFLERRGHYPELLLESLIASFVKRVIPNGLALRWGLYES